MNAEDLVSKYIAGADDVLRKMEREKGPITVTDQSIDEILGYIRAYLEDAKYYKDQKKFETSLTSIAYCEGLIDSLKLIGAVKIQSQ